MATVEVKDIRKTFGGKTEVLKGVSFQANDGEFVSLLGPSGCGKTTLLRIIAGLEFADAGSVTIGDREVSAVPPKDRDIAMVFQNYALYPHLRVKENIEMGLKLRKVERAEIDRRVKDSAGMLGLEELLNRKPSALSGGQRQRVALARALVRKPKVYLLDEPLSNLDAVLRDKTRGELKLLFKRVHGTAVYVTHDQVEAMTLSDRIVVLNNGVIQQVGTPDEIYHQPANTFVAGFLGAPPMNVFPLESAGGVVDVGSRDGNLLCGIRAEDVEFSVKEKEGFHRARIKLAEPTGAQTILTVEAGPLSVRAVWFGFWDQLRGKEEIYFRLPEDQLHFFEAESGRRV